MNSLHSHLGSDFVASLPDLSFALSCLDGTNVELRQHWIDEVGEVLTSLVGQWENAQCLAEMEKLVTYLSDLSQDCLPHRMKVFSSSPQILRPLFSIMVSWLSIEDKRSQLALRYHHCYHLAVFIILGMINGRDLCELLLQTIDRYEMFDLLRKVAELLLVEIQYSSQEMVLEILCRFYLVYIHGDGQKAEDLLCPLPCELRSAFKNLGPQSILGNMRPFLKEVSAFNPYIVSVCVSHISYSAGSIHIKSEDEKSYLDFGVEVFSFYYNESSIVSLDYSSVFTYSSDEKMLSIQLSNRGDKRAGAFQEACDFSLDLHFRSLSDWKRAYRIFTDQIVNLDGGSAAVERDVLEQRQPLHESVLSINQVRPSRSIQQSRKANCRAKEKIYSRSSGDISLPCILDHLQIFFDRKSRKKQAKLRNKESVLLCTELEDYIKTKWEPYVLHKISSRNNSGHQNLDILAREIQSHFQEAEKQIEAIERRYSPLSKTLNEISYLVNQTTNKLKKCQENQYISDLNARCGEVTEEVLGHARILCTDVARNKNLNRSQINRII